MMKKISITFLLFSTVMLMASVAYATVTLEETIVLLQNNSPLSTTIQNQLQTTLQTTCGFGTLDLLSVKGNLKTPFSSWPSDIKDKLTGCTVSHPEVLTSIQNSLAIQAQQFPVATAPPVNTDAQQTTQTSGNSGFTALAPIPGLTDATKTSVVDSESLAAFFNNLYMFVIGLSAALAVIMIIWGGLNIATQDSVSKQSEGKERIQQAILGLVLVLLPVLVFSVINPSILNLSLNLPKLDTISTSSEPAQNAAVPYTIGSGPSCNGTVINVAGSGCSQTIFNEGPYVTSPPGAWCYQLKTPLSENGVINNVMCYRTQEGCRATCRTSDGYPAARIPDPTNSDPNCTAACVQAPQ